MIVDYHMHLRDEAGNITFTPDAVRPFLATALARGVAEIGFTEHVYYFRADRASSGTFPTSSERCVYDLDDYCNAVLEAKRQGLPVKLGLEVDYVGEQQARLAELLEPYPFDYLLGSVHWLDGMAVDMSPGVWEVMTVDEGWRALHRRALRAGGLADRARARASRSREDLRQAPRPGSAGRAARAGRSGGCGVRARRRDLHGRSPKAGRRALPRPRLSACLRARRRTRHARLRCARARSGRRELRPGARARAAAGAQTVAVFDGGEQRLEQLG